MEAFFSRVVGCVAEKQPPLTTPRSKRRASAAIGKGLASSDEALVPDLAKIASTTELGRLSLEDDAQNLDKASMPEALALVRRWCQGLRRRPRPDEPFASFRAQYLRSAALESALDALRRNEVLRGALFLDPPLFGARGPTSDDGELLAELQQLLQICLPRAASPLAVPAIRAVFTAPSERVTLALSVVRAFKDDWTEAVRNHALRGLERRVDSLAYELQKSQPPRQTRSSGKLSSREGASIAHRASRDIVAVLAVLCEILSETCIAMEARKVHIARTLSEWGFEVSETSSAGEQRGGSGKRDMPTPLVAEEDKNCAAKGWCHADSGTSSSADLGASTASDFEAAIIKIASKSEEGVQDGLRLLGLPDAPLSFAPGLELKLRGHDIRARVNAMISYWFDDNMEEFHKTLIQIRAMVAQPSSEGEASDPAAIANIGQPPGASHVVEQTGMDDLLYLRGLYLQERQAILHRLHGLDRRLESITAQLERLPRPENTEDLVAPLLTRDRSEYLAPSCSAPSHDRFPPQNAPPDFATLVVSTAGGLLGEMQRNIERLATQRQQRRAQLLHRLDEHLRDTGAHLSRLSVPGAVDKGSGYGVGDAATSACDAFDMSLRDARHLCSRAEAVLGTRPQADEQSKAWHCGARCQAKWIDGNFYDATVQSILGDGTFIVNWLRPAPSDCGPERRAFVTISESGGDDTLHRFVPCEDVRHIPDGDPENDDQNPQSKDELMASRLFQARSAEDLCCAECDASGAEWASVSFGTYLCRGCAQEHIRLGPRLSLVRRLNDGRGWVHRDLEYLKLGGNARFKACLGLYLTALTSATPIAERCASRFGEYYRRNLDAVCTGAQPPPAPTPESASQRCSGEFLSAAEAAEVLHEVVSAFTKVSGAARESLPTVRSCLPGDTSRSGAVVAMNRLHRAEMQPL